MEFYFATGQTHLEGDELSKTFAGLGDEFCTNFYETLDTDYCVNVNMGVDKGQWCYVDSSCAALNGGAAVASDLSWKKCQAGQDKMFRDFEPEALMSFALAADLNFALLHKMSYPLYRGGLWKDVAAFWNVPLTALDTVPEDILGSGYGKLTGPSQLQDFVVSTGRWGGSSISEQHRSEMQAIKDSRKPFSFDMDSDQHPPHIIVEGEKVYLVFWGDHGSLKCISGC